ncbi:MAG: IS481 family transposase [Deltaproteobacteria bacterium]|nr:IS481 family transposase [Deltaproteobacteria bacterium]
MPWAEVTRMSLREEFVQLAMQPGVNRRELCRRFGISPKTGYKWLARHTTAEASGLCDRSRRPRHSPTRTIDQVAERVIELRRESRNSWGGRKLARLLVEEGGPRLAPSTITGIVRRAGLLDVSAAPGQRAWQRFEHVAPNALWQMDFKGYFPLLDQSRCHPLSVLDDHSRFAVLLRACADQRAATVQNALTNVFRRYGLPAAMLMDNGAPWGDRDLPFTGLTLGLIRLGIRVSHGRPYHPQTPGKDQRFHRTLKFEVLRHFNFTTFEHCQRELDRFRDCYNLRRPHHALNLATPASRYYPSAIAFPETLPPIDYPPGLDVRKVQAEGWVSYRSHALRVCKALRGLPVAFRLVEQADSQREVLFCHQVIARIDLNQAHANARE